MNCIRIDTAGLDWSVTCSCLIVPTWSSILIHLGRIRLSGLFRRHVSASPAPLSRSDSPTCLSLIRVVRGRLSNRRRSDIQCFCVPASPLRLACTRPPSRLTSQAPRRPTAPPLSDSLALRSPSVAANSGHLVCAPLRRDPSWLPCRQRGVQHHYDACGCLARDDDLLLHLPPAPLGVLALL